MPLSKHLICQGRIMVQATCRTADHTPSMVSQCNTKQGLRKDLYHYTQVGSHYKTYIGSCWLFIC